MSSGVYLLAVSSCNRRRAFTTAPLGPVFQGHFSALLFRIRSSHRHSIHYDVYFCSACAYGSPLLYDFDNFSIFV